MNQKILIQNKNSYEAIKARGFEPLTDYQFTEIEIRLRVSLQFELFGESEFSRGDVLKANQKFYIWNWNNNIKVCQNCTKPLFSNRNIDNAYSAIYISHIMTRKAFPEMAHDPRNVNILCGRCHEKWEIGNRKEMLIYPLNQIIIRILKNEYQKLKLC